MVNECSSLPPGMPASVVVGGVGRVAVIVVPFEWGFVVRDRRDGLPGNSSHCPASPSDSERGSAFGASGGAVSPCMPLPSGEVDESLALPAVITTLGACAGAMYCGAISGSTFRRAARILMPVAVADQAVEIVLPSGEADTVTNCPGEGG